MKRTRSAPSWGLGSTLPLALAVPRWWGKQYERTPRSRLVIALNRRASSSSWAEDGLKRYPMPEGDVGTVR